MFYGDLGCDDMPSTPTQHTLDLAAEVIALRQRIEALTPLGSAEGAIASILDETKMLSLPVLALYFKDGRKAREELDELKASGRVVVKRVLETMMKSSFPAAGGETARSLLAELKLPRPSKNAVDSNPFDVSITVALARRIHALLDTAAKRTP